METNIYKDKYIRAKNAYKNLEDDYNNVVNDYNNLKELLITELEKLKREEYSNYDDGYNTGVEHSIGVIVDMAVPIIFDMPTIEISRLEYELLKYFNDKGYKYIARDRDEVLYIYKERPSKNEDVWCTEYGHAKCVKYLEELFTFVKWGNAEPTLIKGIINSAEVVSNAKR